MKIDTSDIQPLAAVISSVILLLAARQRVVEIIALIASSVWLALALGIFKWPISGVKPGLAIGAALLISGIILHLRTSTKREVTAATVITVLGGILVFKALG